LLKQADAYLIPSTEVRSFRLKEFLWAILEFLVVVRTTGNEAYREEALKFVRAYQKVFPYWPRTYSLHALLGKDAAARSLAACRARYLDPGVRFS